MSDEQYCDEWIRPGWACSYPKGHTCDHRFDRWLQNLPELKHRTDRASILRGKTAAERKGYPIWTGVIEYFPDALLEIARVSKVGNDQHNPGEPLHWARGKSMDQMDTLGRHLLERGSLDDDGVRHTAKAAWRILAELQLEIEADRDKEETR